VRSGYGIFYGFPEATNAGVLSISVPNKILLNTGSNTIDPTLILDQPVFGPSPFNTALINPNFFAIYDPNTRPEMVQMYNLTVQRELSSNLMLEVGYLGNRSTGGLVTTNANDAASALPNDTSSPQSRRLVSPQLGNLTYYAPQGSATYNAFTASLEKRFSRGLSLLASYTWSRALGIGVSAGANGLNDAPILNPLDLRREYGPIDFDVINRGVFSYVYEFPFGKGRTYLTGLSPVWNFLVGGWQASGITTLQGGFPLTPVLGSSLGKTFTNSRPDAIGDPTQSARQPYNWLNPAAFAIPTNAQIAAGDFFGNIGRGSVRAPGLVNFDFSLMKSFSIREFVRMQYRCEVFNFTNTPFFGLPSSVGLTVNTATFGKITAAGDPRVIQMALKLIF
jgi:hypothetical protein